MQIIDVDTHVIESDGIWDCLGTADEEFRPCVLRKERGATIQAHFSGKDTREYWVIDNDLYGKHDVDLIVRHANGEFGAGAATLQDIPARLADMDRQRVDVQVVFSSLFLNVRCRRPQAELALTRAYDRWLAQRCAESAGRLRWVFVPSLKNAAETALDMRWARDQGAVGVLFRGLEGDKFLDHPDFDPVYAAASDLDLPICVHIGHGSPAFESIAQRDGARFNRFISDSPNYFAFSVLLNSRLREAFPRLRFGFFESGCTWVTPAVQTALHVRLPPAQLMQLVQEKLAEHNFYFTCEMHEDLAHIVRYTGDERLMASSDYGHPGDIADSVMYRAQLEQRQELAPPVREKLLRNNAHGLFRL